MFAGPFSALLVPETLLPLLVLPQRSHLPEAHALTAHGAAQGLPPLPINLPVPQTLKGIVLYGHPHLLSPLPPSPGCPHSPGITALPCGLASLPSAWISGAVWWLQILCFVLPENFISSPFWGIYWDWCLDRLAVYSSHFMGTIPQLQLPLFLLKTSCWLDCSSAGQCFSPSPFPASCPSALLCCA